jgi:hypothetical protein
MGGGGGGGEVKYVGPTKEELAQRQAENDKQISLMQQQNLAVQQRYDAMRADADKALAERTSLMQQELERQRTAYDEVLGTTKKSLEDSQEVQTRQSELMASSTAKQEQALKLQNAQADKDTTMARDAMNMNRRSINATMNNVRTRTRRRRLLSQLN